MKNKNILCYIKKGLLFLAAICLLIVLTICILIICNRSKEIPTLTITPRTNTIELNTSNYYIEKIMFLDVFSDEVLYEMSFGKEDGISKINLLSLPKEYPSERFFELSDTGNYEIKVYTVGIKNREEYYLTFELAKIDTISVQIRPFFMRP